jgi:hypothetical protein
LKAKELNMAQESEDDRLAHLEQVIARLQEHIVRQQEQMTRQQAQITRLEAAQVPIAATAAAEPVEPARGDQRRGRVAHGGTRSRRALLKLGGAAAAAGVAAVAAGATELAHPGTAQAASGSFDSNDPNIPAVSATGTNGAWGVIAYSSGVGNRAIEGDGLTDAIGVAGHSVNSTGVNGLSSSGVGVYGTSSTSTGVNGLSTSGVGVWGQSISSTGVNGLSASGVGVWGESSTSTGVNGLSTSGAGVWGHSGSGNAVVGTSGSGAGVYGTSTDYAAVQGSSTNNVGGFFTGNRAALALGAGGAPGAPTSGEHFQGDIYLDSMFTVWVCSAHGTPGTWTRLAGVANGSKGGAITYLSTPVRLLDARGGASSGLVNRGALAGNEVFTFAVAGLGGSGIPSNAQGLIANVTVLGPSSTGNLSLFPAGGAPPTVASMTFGQPGVALANGVNVAIGSGGAINIQNQSSGFTPLVLDAVAFVG